MSGQHLVQRLPDATIFNQMLSDQHMEYDAKEHSVAGQQFEALGCL